MSFEDDLFPSEIGVKNKLRNLGSKVKLTIKKIKKPKVQLPSILRSHRSNETLIGKVPAKYNGILASLETGNE